LQFTRAVSAMIDRHAGSSIRAAMVWGKGFRASLREIADLKERGLRQPARDLLGDQAPHLSQIRTLTPSALMPLPKPAPMFRF
jgi:hypothetical protein